MAAYYPEKPCEEEQAAMRGFLTGLALFYPCSHCAEAFRQDLIKFPPQLESREALVVWMCKQHNLVNANLGKSDTACKLSALDLRWRDGDPACWSTGDGDATAMESLGQASMDDDDGEDDDDDDDDAEDGADEGGESTGGGSRRTLLQRVMEAESRAGASRT